MPFLRVDCQLEVEKVKGCQWLAYAGADTTADINLEYNAPSLIRVCFDCIHHGSHLEYLFEVMWSTKEYDTRDHSYVRSHQESAQSRYNPVAWISSDINWCNIAGDSTFSKIGQSPVLSVSLMI